MKKLLLSFVLITGLGWSASAQVEIYLEGTTTDISGSVEYYTLSTAVTNEHLVNFLFTNLSGSDETWMITRRIVNQPANWSNYFCWGPSGQFGDCYDTTSMEYFNSGTKIIVDQAAGLVSTYVNAPDAGTAHYRYYVSNDGVNFIDSVDLSVTSTLSVTSLSAETFDLVVAPNPAPESMVVSAKGIQDATILITDLLGNEVLHTQFAESQIIDVSNYRNGVYFVTIASKEGRISRKVVVRH